jgi:hypothetical protein
MMRLARRASLVVVLLLASVGLLSADSGWVLWSTVREKDGPWAIEATGKDLKTCNRFAQMFAENEAALSRLPPEARPLYGYRPSGSYICLPDTVHPRGAKGK